MAQEGYSLHTGQPGNAAPPQMNPAQMGYGQGPSPSYGAQPPPQHGMSPHPGQVNPFAMQQNPQQMNASGINRPATMHQPPGYVPPGVSERSYAHQNAKAQTPQEPMPYNSVGGSSSYQV